MLVHDGLAARGHSCNFGATIFNSDARDVKVGSSGAGLFEIPESVFAAAALAGASAGAARPMLEKFHVPLDARIKVICGENDLETLQVHLAREN